MSRSQPELNPWTQRPPYRVPRHPAVTDLQLAGNGSAAPAGARGCAWLPAAVAVSGSQRTQRRLAARHGLHDDQVLITAGGDEGLQRLCRAAPPGSGWCFPATFEMIRRFVSRRAPR